MEHIEWNGKRIPVFGGAWLDPMNSCFYKVIDKIDGYDICNTDDCDNVTFALPTR